MLDLPVRNLMSDVVVTVRRSAPLDEVVETMFEREISSLVVLGDQSSEPIGVVTKTDVLEALTWEQEDRNAVQVFGLDLLDGMDYLSRGENPAVYGGVNPTTPNDSPTTLWTDIQRYSELLSQFVYIGYIWRFRLLVPTLVPYRTSVRYRVVWIRSVIPPRNLERRTVDSGPHLGRNWQNSRCERSESVHEEPSVLEGLERTIESESH